MARILSGLILAISAIVIYGTPEEGSLIETFPIIALSKLIEDLYKLASSPLLTKISVIGGFFKISIFFYAAVLGVRELIS